MRTKEEYTLLAEKLLANTYKPHQLLQEELIEAFVVRLKVFERLYRDISTTERTSFGPHYLIEGQRGMGKTTLLLRLCYELELDKNLPAWLLPLALKEEQYYSITRLSDLWQRIVEVLADSYPQFEPLEKSLEKYMDLEADKEVEKQYFELLIADLRRQDKKLVLFMDNMGVTFERLNEYEQQRLRQIMQTYSEIQFIGASHKIWDNYANYSKPFYDFFTVEKLKALTSDEINTLLQKLAEGNARLERIMRTQRTRIEVMRTLTGGNIRTTLLVFQALAQDEDGQALQDLEFLLNEVTPYYKARLDDLTPLEQNVIDALATHWSSMTLPEVAKKLRRTEDEVAKELERLSQTIWLDKIQESPETLLYRLSERFFNIWYLMRMSRTKDRNRVEWFVKMLEVWFDYNAQEINEKAQEHIKNLENPAYIASSAYTMTEALLRTGLIKWDIQEQLLQATKNLLNGKDKHLANELSEADDRIMENVFNILEITKYDGKPITKKQEVMEQCSKELDKIKNKSEYKGLVWFMKYLIDKDLDIENAINHLEKAINLGNSFAYYELSGIYAEQGQYKANRDLLIKYQSLDDKESLASNGLFWGLIMLSIELEKYNYLISDFEQFKDIKVDLNLFEAQIKKGGRGSSLPHTLYIIASLPLLYVFDKKKIDVDRLENIFLQYNNIKNNFHSHCILALFYLNLKIDKQKYLDCVNKISTYRIKKEVDNILSLNLKRIANIWHNVNLGIEKINIVNESKFSKDAENIEFLVPIIGKLYNKILKLEIAKKTKHLHIFSSILEQDNELSICRLIAPYYAFTDNPKVHDFYAKVPPYQLKDIERIMAEIAQMRIDYA